MCGVMDGSSGVSSAAALRLALSLVSGAALALAYPDYDLTLLGWVALAGLIFCSLGAGRRLAAGCGLLFGLAYYVISLPWIYTVLRVYGPVPAWEAAILLGLLSLAASIFCALFAALVAEISRRREGLALIAAPFLWVSLEFLRTHLPDIGFPWDLLGYTASGSLALLQITSLTGIYGLSLLVAGYNSLFLWLLLSINRRRTRSAASPAALAWVGTTAGLVAIAALGGRLVPQAQPTQVAHLVQTNLPQALEYGPDWDTVHAADMNQLEQMTIAAGQRRPGLVVWPEVPAPFSLQQPAFGLRAARIARESQSDFLVGVIHWKASGGQVRAFNSAVMLDPAGRQSFVYDKIHLVPFSEYIPWRSWLFFARDLTGLVGDFARGTEYAVGELPGGHFSVFICYEAIFPDEVRRFVLNGAEVMINVSDDGWFGRSSALSQHLAMARVRAAENRRWLLRDTNTGETVSVDPYGRIVARLPRDERGVLDAPYGFRNDMTLYTRWGDWIAWVCVAAGLGLLIAGKFAGPGGASSAPNRRKGRTR
jgi:apolipoprotein N-acyltransferase